MAKRVSGRSVPKRSTASPYSSEEGAEVSSPPGSLRNLGHHSLDEVDDVLFTAEGHLQVDLGELRLPVCPEILVSKASHT